MVRSWLNPVLEGIIVFQEAHYAYGNAQSEMREEVCIIFNPDIQLKKKIERGLGCATTSLNICISKERSTINIIRYIAQISVLKISNKSITRAKILNI